MTRAWRQQMTIGESSMRNFASVVSIALGLMGLTACSGESEKVSAAPADPAAAAEAVAAKPDDLSLIHI